VIDIFDVLLGLAIGMESPTRAIQLVDFDGAGRLDDGFLTTESCCCDKKLVNNVRLATWLAVQRAMTAMLIEAEI